MIKFADTQHVFKATGVWGRACIRNKYLERNSKLTITSKNPTGRRQTSWLSTSVAEELKLGLRS